MERPEDEEEKEDENEAYGEESPDKYPDSDPDTCPSPDVPKVKKQSRVEMLDFLKRKMHANVNAKREEIGEGRERADSNIGEANNAKKRGFNANSFANQ